jgi:NMD protein affecting ribosome stability and mRNA decay
MACYECKRCGCEVQFDDSLLKALEHQLCQDCFEDEHPETEEQEGR